MNNKTIQLNFAGSVKVALENNLGFIQVIIGPRQVGKTTTTLSMLEESFKGRYLFYNADTVFNADAKWILEVWQEARRQKKILVIDEIQKTENWSEVIKKLWDEDKRNGDFNGCLLLGSSSLAIQKGLTESLTGRFQLHLAFHWNFRESNEGYQFGFEEYLKKGGYPGSYQFRDETEWANYVKTSIILTVIEKDILQYHTVKKPALFKQAFEILMSYPAQEISYTKLLGQIQDSGNVELIKYYLSLYEGAYLVKVLEKFSGNKIVTKSSSPKILPLAPCLYYLETREQYTAEEKGRVFEVIVGMQLVRTRENLYYWREGNNEVDYVLKVGKTIYAIEVKSGRKRMKSGLLKFVEKYPKAKAIIITPENYFDFENDPMAFLKNL